MELESLLSLVWMWWLTDQVFSYGRWEGLPGINQAIIGTLNPNPLADVPAGNVFILTLLHV